MFQQDVCALLSDRPWLEPVFADNFHICERIRDVDDTLFLVRNHLNGTWELHCTEHRPNTFAWVVPWRVLDERTVRKADRNRMAAQGKNFFEDLIRRNEERDRREDRRRREEIRNMAKDTRSIFAKIDPG
jgi:hypothetical protein